MVYLGFTTLTTKKLKLYKPFLLQIKKLIQLVLIQLVFIYYNLIIC